MRDFLDSRTFERLRAAAKVLEQFVSSVTSRSLSLSLNLAATKVACSLLPPISWTSTTLRPLRPLSLFRVSPPRFTASFARPPSSTPHGRTLARAGRLAQTSGTSLPYSVDASAEHPSDEPELTLDQIKESIGKWEDELKSKGKEVSGRTM